MNTYLLTIEWAKTMDRERQEKAEYRRLLRQIQAERPHVLNHLGLYLGKLVMTLALALRLR